MSEMETRNKINCEVIGDLMPLYIDGALSDSSAILVEEHIAVCESCEEKIGLLRGEAAPAANDSQTYREDIAPLTAIKKSITRRKVTACAVTAGVMLLLFGMVLLVHYLKEMKLGYDYSELETHIRVVSTSDIASTDNPHSISVLYDGNDSHIQSDTYYKKIGISGGKIQVEAYVYAYHQPFDDWNIFCCSQNFTGEVKGFLLLCDDPTASYKSGIIYATEGLNGYYDFNLVDIPYSKEDIEIVRIYYAKWSYDNGRNGASYIIDDRSYLLWEKPGV